MNGRRLCAHADQDGDGAHWLEPGESCSLLDNAPQAPLHGAAWHIPSDDGSDYGVLVRCGPSDHPYWWLLCPGTATLYIKSSGADLRECHDAGCVWDDVHAAAHQQYLLLTAPSSSAGADTRPPTP